MKTSSMELEIFQQPSVIRNIVEHYVLNSALKINMPNFVKKVRFIASGSSYNCARLGQKFFEDIAQIDCMVDFSSEFLSKKDPKLDSETLYIFVSQSGETADTLAALKKIKTLSSNTLVITNVQDSTMWNLADYKMYVYAGEENSIAATKSFSACVFCLYLCSLYIAQNKCKNIFDHINNLQKIPKDIEKLFEDSKTIKEAAKFLAKHKCFPIVGYDYYYILAKEGALKIKETSYIDANAYALGEFMHGHIALLNGKKPVIEIFTSDLTRFQYKNLRKIKLDYDPKIICITDYKKPLKVQGQILFDNSDEISRIFCITVILQLLALEIAKKLKRNIDNPKGLKKVLS